MQNQEKVPIVFNSANLVVFVYKWKKPLFIMTLTTVVLSTIAAFLITPKYKAVVVLFPTTTSSISKALLTKTNTDQKDILQFGDEEEAEQTLQILNSDEIREKIARKYNLLDHYKIDPDAEFRQTELYEEYEDNITFERTEFLSVKITVYDTDPQMAADIANDIAALLDSTKNRMQSERAKQALKIVEAEYKNLCMQVRQTDDSLKMLRNLGINDYETQSEVFNAEYATALARGNSSGVKAIEEKLKILGEYGGAYVRLRESLSLDLITLNDLKSKFHEVKVDAEQTLPHAFIVDRAYKAEKKSYPIRWLIILTSTIASFLLTLLVITTIETYSKFKTPDLY